MKDKYEISLWEDYPDVTSGGVPFLNERKLCVIGSDTMMSNIRATEPTMINNVNGTNTFSFKMRHTYIDEITGEKIQNPFLSLLINERKVKVLWKDKWYDMLIKNLDEDSTGKTITYTCEDIFITELSKNGYSLEFSSDLQNNTGTAAELVEQVLDGSGWQFDNENSVKIIQKTEESVYEATVINSFSATIQSPDSNELIIIPVDSKILIFYSSIAGISSGYYDIEFVYSPVDYETEENSTLVLNGDCYKRKLYTIVSGGTVLFKENESGSELFRITTLNGISTTYRANRLVNNYVTEYDALLERYVNVYTDVEQPNTKVYGYSTVEYSDPLTVVNLIVNSSNFRNTEGWIVVNGNDSLSYSIYPPFESTTSIDTYHATSWLKVPEGDIYNSAFSSNKQYLVPSQGDVKRGFLGGFQIGDQYIFRIKYKYDRSNSSYITSSDIITPLITTFNSSTYAPTGTNYFEVDDGKANGNWREYLLTCIEACPADVINTLGLFLHIDIEDSQQTYEYIEDIQFFKYAEGITSYEDTTKHRINPGEVSLQSIEKTVYKYYNSNHDGAINPEALNFLSVGEELPERFAPVSTNFEKLATIEAKESNRFNILQSIAESFKCWIRFTINHDESGKMVLDEDGLPEKYVTLVEELGADLGWSFEYGIDLKSIHRKIISSELTTKVIVRPNDNEFGINGFCSIARSNLNYTRENFILNLDYYIDQGLLDKDIVNRDLYSTSNNYIGYYYNLNKYNKEYDELTNLLLQKQIELTKQQSQLVVLTEQQKATLEQKGNYEADIMAFACVDTWAAAQDYVQANADNTKVQSLMNAIGQLTSSISENAVKIHDLESSINTLKEYILERDSRQKQLTSLTSELHERFFKKYARYIQEGTWQDSNYIDDDKYYLDAVDVAYTSSRPQLQYDINVMRLTVLEDFSSKIFDVGDICYIQDREFFGYGADGITPYKLKIIISEITSYFDEPEKDTIKVQNYKTQFDDLFQRITATTQSLQYAQGGYARAAETIRPDKTLSFDLLQNTFDYNQDLVLNASNQQVTWDSTGITVTDNNDTAQKVRLMAGGLFISNDGGVTWKNAVRGDGISADTLTAGRINTGEIFVYDGAHPSFRWDSSGINAYFIDTSDVVNLGKFVRFDRLGIYGYSGQNDFEPATEEAIWNNSDVKFGLTWKGFFLRGSSGNSNLEISDNGTGIAFKMKNQIGNNSLEISTENDILLKTGNINRVQIGRLNPSSSTSEYGIWIKDANNNNIFNVSSSGTNSIGGWTLTENSFYHVGTINNATSEIGLYSSGKRATIQGDTGDYYILAGSNFGVKLDGTMYCSAGKVGGWAIDSATLTGGNVTINSNGTISCMVGNTLKWELDNAGGAVFNNIQADGGTIAGWHITPESIYLTDASGNIRTSLNSGWDASYNVSKYTIVTNSISAGGGSIGGWGINPASLTSKSVTLDPSGSITISGVTLTGYSGGGLNISGYTNVGGSLNVHGTITVEGGTIYFGESGQALTMNDIIWLHNLKNNYNSHTHSYAFYNSVTQETVSRNTGVPPQISGN